MKRQIKKVKQILYATSFLTMITAFVFVTVATVEAVIAPVTYVIYRDATTIYAQNGQTGVNDYYGTDAATVINQAINALPATGGEIVIKGGTYNTYSITSNFMAGVTKPVTLLLGDTVFSVSGVTLTVGTKQRIIGSGRGRTVFNFSNTGTADGFSVTATECELKGFTVDMQNIGTGRGIFVNAFFVSRMEQIEVARSGGVGILFQSAPGLNVHRSFARDIVTRNNASHGWHVQTPSGGATGNDQFVVEMLNSHNNGGQGIRLETNVDGQRNSKTTYIHARPQNNAGDGVLLIGDGDIIFTSLESEGNSGWGFNTSLGGSGSLKVNGVWLINAFFGMNTLGSINIPQTTATNIIYSESFTSLRLPQLRAISDSDGTVPLIMGPASASATADILQAQSWNSVPLFRIKSNGKLSANAVQPIYVTTESTGMVNLAVERITGQTADLQQWSNEYGGVLASIGNTGVALVQSLRTNGRISAKSTPAKNLRGQATLNAGIGSLVVSFPTVEPDASYYIQLTGNGNNTLWVTNKTTTGFTINRSSTTGTRIVDWLLVR